MNRPQEKEEAGYEAEMPAPAEFQPRVTQGHLLEAAALAQKHQPQGPRVAAKALLFQLPIHLT